MGNSLEQLQAKSKALAESYELSSLQSEYISSKFAEVAVLFGQLATIFESISIPQNTSWSPADTSNSDQHLADLLTKLNQTLSVIEEALDQPNPG